MVHSLPWAQQWLAPQRAWPVTRGSGVVVAVLDSGVAASVPQLAGRVEAGVDVLAAGPATTDCTGHGTFAAGLIAAASAPGVGFVGVAPAATILPVRVADGGSVSAAVLAEGVRAAVDRGANVIDVPVTVPASTPGLASAVGYARSHDVVVVAGVADGAGTDPTADPRGYPAAYPSVLSVAALAADGTLTPAQSGAAAELAAPGADLVSVGPGGGGQVTGEGTGFAASLVAGTAALVRAYWPHLDAAGVVHRLEATADPPPDGQGTSQIRWGEVNPASAVGALLPEEWPGGVLPASASTGVHVVRPVPPGHRATVVALGVLGLAAVLATAGWLLGYAIPAGRHRPATPTAGQATSGAAPAVHPKEWSGPWLIDHR